MKKLIEDIKKIIASDFRKLLSHSKNYLSANIFIAILSFLSLPIMTRLLSTDQYGLVSIFISIVSILEIIFILSINGAIKINFIKENYNHREYLFSNLIALIGINIIFFLILLILNNNLAIKFNIPFFLIITAGITAIGGVFLNIKLSLLQGKQESKLYSLISIMKESSIILFSLIAIALLKSNRELGYIYVTLIMTLLFSLYSFLSLLKESKFVFKIKYVKDAIFFGLPLLPHALSGFLLKFVDQLIINQLVGASKTGIYSLGYKVGSLMHMVAISFNNAWQPIYWKLIKEEKWKEMNKLAQKFSFYIFWIAIILIIFSKEIIIIISERSYYEAMYITPFVVLSYTFFYLYTLYSGISYYKKKTWLISINTIVAVSVNIVLNYALIPLYGFKVAAITTLISYVILFFLNYCTSNFILKYDKLKIKSTFTGIIYVLSAFCITIILLYNNLTYNVELLIKILTLIVTSVLMFKRQISSLSKILLKK
jgi:O-antigen/teichoic acid export membrane protein